MTPREAATIIGCSLSQVRNLIRVGKLRAKRIYGGRDHLGQQQYTYSITRHEAERYRDAPMHRGWPRGKPRGARR